jgi:hypothetical protein
MKNKRLKQIQNLFNRITLLNGGYENGKITEREWALGMRDALDQLEWAVSCVENELLAA